MTTVKKEVLKARAQRVRESIEEMLALLAKQDKLFGELLFHCLLWDHGIEREDVKEYVFKSRTQRNGAASQRHYPNEYNEIHLKDGTRLKVEPFLLPEREDT